MNVTGLSSATGLTWVQYGVTEGLPCPHLPAPLPPTPTHTLNLSHSRQAAQCRYQLAAVFAEADIYTPVHCKLNEPAADIYTPVHC